MNVEQKVKFTLEEEEATEQIRKRSLVKSGVATSFRAASIHIEVVSQSGYRRLTEKCINSNLISAIGLQYMLYKKLNE